MYGPAGAAYVYLVYGMYDCLNVVTEPAPQPAAVLIRAVEPLEGADSMRASRLDWHARRRRTAPTTELERERRRLARIPDSRLASGPGLVCAAFGIDRAMTGLDLCDAASPLRLEERSGQEPAVAASHRIGVGYAGETWAARPWRLYVAGNPAVSGRPR